MSVTFWWKRRSHARISRMRSSRYVRHYHCARNYQGLANELIEPVAANSNAGEGVVRRRARLGGLLSYYHRDAV